MDLTQPQPPKLALPKALAWLPSTLLEPRRPLAALATSVALTLAGSVILAFLVQALLPGLASPEPPPAALPPWLVIFSYVVFAPVVESIIMGGILLLLLRWLVPGTAIAVSAAGWGVLHSLAAAAWGLIIWWPFVIFSTLFVVWRQRGFWTGVGMATAAHMLQNLGPGLLLAFR